MSASSAENKVKDSPVDSPEEPALKQILVPTDFSESAEQALNYAVRLSKPYRAEIVVLHVFHLREYLALLSEKAQIDSATANEVLESAKRRAAHNLEEIVRRQGDEGLTLVPSLRIGLPFEEIISYAAEQGIDLIVRPTHGRTGLAHFFLGSTAERVISHSACPVLVVKTRPAVDDHV